MSISVIKVRGARQHNLKNISLDIPKNKLVVITGISGSGKSSLAFDTIYAEGQRRYVESLSAYARQFLGLMEKPDVDLIEGLSPAISIDQKTTTHNPRSTVGTITEIYDYFRLLYARIGHPHCPHCQTEISRLSIDEMVDRVIGDLMAALAKDKIKPLRYFLLSPIVRQKKGEFRSLFDNLRSKGYQWVKVDGRLVNLNKEISLIKTNKHNISLVIKEGAITNKSINDASYQKNLKDELKRLIEPALLLSDGLLILEIAEKERLYSEKYSCPNCNLSLPELEPRMFSFNSPLGACPKCHGLGTIYQIDPELILNKNLTINEGAIIPFSRFFYQDTWYIRLLKTVCQQEKIDLNQPLKDLPKEKINLILYGNSKIYQVFGTNRFGRETVIYERFEGIIKELEKRFFDNQTTEIEDISNFIREKTCPQCRGLRLKKESLSVTIDQMNIAQLSSLSIRRLKERLDGLFNRLEQRSEKEIAKPILKEIGNRLDFLINVGLDYLTIDRRGRTLSGGEQQRIRLASQIGSGLTGVLYVLDEPSIGLHPRDIQALIDSLKKLRDLGNTLIIVEHDEKTIRNADFLIELGPRAGKNGGRIVFQGAVNQMIKDSHSLTGDYLAGKKQIKPIKRRLNFNCGQLTLKKVKTNNLKSITVHFPLGNLIGVTGVSGSGKSSLVTDTLYPALKYYLDGFYQQEIGVFAAIDGYQYLDRVYLVDQSPIGRTPRSNIATYIGFFDEIRNIFTQTVEAKVFGFSKSRFSFNVKGGRCEKCQGAGVIKVEMQFLADLYVTCDSCQGRRYNQQTLEVRYKNKDIAQVLELTVDEAIEFFGSFPKIIKKLELLRRVGLGYLQLGQPAPTFSGGEAQRIKLANELTKKSTGRTLYILDEPTTGLHFDDVDKLIKVLVDLVGRGNTVIVIEHNLEVIKNCQYLIDLGPEGGDKGGYLVYQGPINDIVNCSNSYTGKYLRDKF